MRSGTISKNLCDTTNSKCPSSRIDAEVQNKAPSLRKIITTGARRRRTFCRWAEQADTRSAPLQIRPGIATCTLPTSTYALSKRADNGPGGNKLTQASRPVTPEPVFTRTNRKCPKHRDRAILVHGGLPVSKSTLPSKRMSGTQSNNKLHETCATLTTSRKLLEPRGTVQCPRVVGPRWELTAKPQRKLGPCCRVRLFAAPRSVGLAVFLGSPPPRSLRMAPPGVCGSRPLLAVWDSRFLGLTVDPPLHETYEGTTLQHSARWKRLAPEVK